MRLVLWPKYLLGGMLQREGGLGGLERGEGGNLIGGLRGIAGRIPDAEALLQGGMSEGLRDWDLWCVAVQDVETVVIYADRSIKGPACVLFAPQLVAIHHSPSERRGFHWGLCTCVDRIGGSDMADTAAGWEDVYLRTNYDL